MPTRAELRTAITRAREMGIKNPENVRRIALKLLGGDILYGEENPPKDEKLTPEEFQAWQVVQARERGYENN